MDHFGLENSFKNYRTLMHCFHFVSVMTKQVKKRKRTKKHMQLFTTHMKSTSWMTGAMRSNSEKELTKRS